MSNLFIDGKFKSHAGLELSWKLECDALKPSDWECIAAIVARNLKFRKVYGIPSGGLPFAQALNKYVTPRSRRILIVDDVFTTGASMEAKFAELGRKESGCSVQGVVLFARKVTPHWIRPVFEFNSFFWD